MLIAIVITHSHVDQSGRSKLYMYGLTVMLPITSDRVHCIMLLMQHVDNVPKHCSLPGVVPEVRITILYERE